MKIIKQLGICMDHSTAFLLELKNGTIVTNSVVSGNKHSKNQENFYKGEKLIHKKEQHLQLSFYKKLGENIRDYEEVILFGATDAKDELFNLLKTDHLFENIKIEVRQSDRMTKSQMQTFVKEYFR